MKYTIAVKQILILVFFLFQTETYAANKCEVLFQLNTSQIKSGAQILHEKDQQLHMSKLVQKAVTKHKQQTGITLTKPNDKLNQWLNYLTKISTKAESSPWALEQVKTILNNQFVIKAQDVPESYFELQVKIAKERGHGEKALSSDQKKQLVDTVILDQIKSLESWTEYLVSKDTHMYPMWIKYWMFTGMTKLSKYNAQSGQFGNRDKSTVAPFAELNHEALSLIVDQVLKHVNKKSLDEINDPEFVKLLSGLNFGKLYGHILFKLGAGRNGKFKTNQGQWVIYRQGSDHISLVKSLAGHNTGWCTAGKATAKSQLDAGDFHVYYSLDEKNEPTIPRVAIRMESQNIAEVRGVAADQNLDSQINQSTVVSSKMKEFGLEGIHFQKKVHDMKMLSLIEAKHSAKIKLSKEEVLFLYEINDKKIQSFGFLADPRIDKIKSERDFDADLVLAFDNKYLRYEISTTINEFVLSKGKSKLHLGTLDLGDLRSARKLKLPEYIFGNLYLSGLKTAEGLQLPMTIDGDLRLNGLKSTEGLKLPSTLNGDLHLTGITSAEGLLLPEVINGSLFLNGLNSAMGLKLPDMLNGYLNLGQLKTTEGLHLPKKINGMLHLQGLTSAKDLKLPEGVTKYYGPDDIQR